MARAGTPRIPITHRPATAGFLILGIVAGCGRVGFEVLSWDDESLVNVGGPDGGVGAEPASEPPPNPVDAGAVIARPVTNSGDSGADTPADANDSSASSGSTGDPVDSTTASAGQGGGGEGGLAGASGSVGGSAGGTLGIGGTGGTPGTGGTGAGAALAGAGGTLDSGGTGGAANGGTTAAGAAGTGGGSTGGFAGAAGAGVCVPDTECACDAYGGSEYRFCGIEETHAGGMAACEAAGMTLIRVDDQAENDWLLAEFTSRGLFLDVSQPMVMLGGTDAVVEGEWRWADGELFWTEADGALLYENWWSFFPKPGVQADCVGMLEDGTWAERACNSGGVTFVCESHSQ